MHIAFITTPYEVDNYNDSYFTPNETEPQNGWVTTKINLLRNCRIKNTDSAKVLCFVAFLIKMRFQIMETKF